MIHPLGLSQLEGVQLDETATPLPQRETLTKQDTYV